MKTETLYRHRPVGLTETLTDAFGIEIYYSTDLLQAIFYAGKSSKSWWFYRFRTLDDMLKRIYDTVDLYVNRQNEKIAEKEKSKELQRDFKASDYYQIGDIVVNSWGYEQTNVDYYQVVEVLNKKIRVKAISAKIAESTGNSMSAMLTPIKDSFLEDNERNNYLLSLKAEYNYTKQIICKICNPESFYYFHKWDGTPDYCSWYY